MNNYTVTLTLNLDADTAQAAAELFAEWVNNTGQAAVLVEDEITGTFITREVSL